MVKISIGNNSVHFSLLDILFNFLLFLSFAILPLFSSLTWISTMIILPMVFFILYFKVLPYKFPSNFFIVKFTLILLLALISIVFVEHLDIYFLEIEKLLGVLLSLLIFYLLLKKNFSNIWLIYFIFVLKFLGMFIYTYYFGVISQFDVESGRLKSGSEVGINANAYGYFAFMALFSLAVLILYFESKFFKLLFLLVFLASIYINVLAASRAGLLFSFFSFFAFLFSFYFKSIKLFFFQFLIISILIGVILLLNISLIEDFIIFQRFYSFAETGEDERVVILELGLNLILSNPFGIGAGHFPLAMSYTNLGKVAASHNSFLLICSNYGIIALVLFFSIFVDYFKSSFHLFRMNNIKLRRISFLFISFGILFLGYNFFYDMVLNLYIMSFFFIFSYHVKVMFYSVLK